MVPRLPGESLLQFIERRLQRFLDVALERIPDRNGNDDDLARLTLLLQSLGRLSSYERRAVHQLLDDVVVTRDCSFRKNDQGPFASHEDVDRRVDGLAVGTLAEDTERAHAAGHEG